MTLMDATTGKIVGLAVIPQDPAALERVSDPAAVMVALVDQARTMLAKATGMEGLADVIEWKSKAEAIRVYTQQKDMGHEAELSAAEIVRRAERRIGQLVREAQEAGEMRRQGQSRLESNQGGDPILSSAEFLPEPQERRDVYAMTDAVSDDEFESGLAEAKAEGNLSRANIVRKVKKPTTTAERIARAAAENPADDTAPRNLPLKQRADQIRRLASKGWSSPQISDEIRISAEHVRKIARQADIEIPADVALGNRFKKIDPNRIIQTVIEQATPLETTLALVAYSELDRSRLEEWVSSLSEAISSLRKIRTALKKELTHDQA